MHSFNGVPIAAAIPVAIESGKLAGSIKTGATQHARTDGAATGPDASSFRDRLQTMFAEDYDTSKTPVPASQINSAIPDAQDSVARKGVSTPQSAPARTDPYIAPSARSLPQPAATPTGLVAPPPANPRTESASPQPASVPSTPPSHRPGREKSSHSGTASDPSSPPVSVSSGTLPQPLAALPQAPVPDPSAPALHTENDSKPALADAAGAAVRTVSPSAFQTTVAPSSLTESREPSATELRELSATEPREPYATQPRERSAASASAKPIEPHSATQPAALASTPGSSPPPEYAAAPLASTDQRYDFDSAPVPSDSAVSVSTRPVEHATKSQPASAVGAAPLTGATHGIANPSDSPGAAPENVNPSASPGAAAEASSAGPTAERSAHASNASKVAPSAPGLDAVASQATAGAQSTAPLAHPASLNASRGSAGPAGSASPAHTDTFAALDSEPPAPPATWIHAGPTRAEAGYLDPSLGWVGVRADVSGNTVHASIMPASAEAAQALGSHLEGLNSYLADHRVAAAQLTMAPSPSSQSFAGNSGFNPSGQQAGQEQRGGEPFAGSGSDSTVTHTADVASVSPVAGFETLAVPAWSGGHISVIA